MLMIDRMDNPFWPPVPKKRPRWPGGLVVAMVVAAGAGVLLTALLNV